jgi:hypothetical protein
MVTPRGGNLHWSPLPPLLIRKKKKEEGEKNKRNFLFGPRLKRHGPGKQGAKGMGQKQ